MLADPATDRQAAPASEALCGEAAVTAWATQESIEVAEVELDGTQTAVGSFTPLAGPRSDTVSLSVGRGGARGVLAWASVTDTGTSRVEAAVLDNEGGPEEPDEITQAGHGNRLKGTRDAVRNGVRSVTRQAWIRRGRRHRAVAAGQRRSRKSRG